MGENLLLFDCITCKCYHEFDSGILEKYNFICEPHEKTNFIAFYDAISNNKFGIVHGMLLKRKIKYHKGDIGQHPRNLTKNEKIRRLLNEKVGKLISGQVDKI